MIIIIIIICYYYHFKELLSRWLYYVQNSSVIAVSRGKLPEMQMAFPHWTAILIFCFKKFPDLGYSVSRRPSSDTKALASGPQGPRVSTAIGVKIHVSLKEAYFFFFRSSAATLTEPAWMADRWRWDLAMVLTQVKSQPFVIVIIIITIVIIIKLQDCINTMSVHKKKETVFKASEHSATSSGTIKCEPLSGGVNTDHRRNRQQT